MDFCIDNVVEWYTGETKATITFSQKKWINKLKKLAKEYPDEVEILNDSEKSDSQPIVAHIPLSWVKLSHPRKGRELTEEEKIAAINRLQNYRKEKKGCE